MAEQAGKEQPQGASVEEKPGHRGPYRPDAIHKPTLTKVRSLAEQLRLDMPENELEDITTCLGMMLEPYEEVYRMVEPKPPVKYPRTPGYRPPPEENPYNAWYIKTDIPGAPTGKLAGRKVAIKDNICVAGVAMMNGSKLMEGHVPDYDATVVTRTLDAGGHILGKAACENFSFSGHSSTNDIMPVLNPRDPTRTTGGSSSGNAALLASGEVDFAVGGDQGGSIRIPSSWCGTVGLKPTFGLLPFTGAVSIEYAVDHVGPMTRNVPDCALFLEVLAGYDGMDARQPENYPTLPEYSKELKSDLKGVKIGLMKEGFMNCAPGVAEIVKKAAEGLRAKGAVVEEVSIPMHTTGVAIWTPVIMDGAHETMLIRGGCGPSSKGFHDTSMMNHLTKSMKSSPNDMSTPCKLISLLGRYLQESNNYQYYCRGSNLTMSLTRAYDNTFKDFDVLIMPTLTYTAPKVPIKEWKIHELVKDAFGMIQNTAPFNSTGHPALTVNAGLIDALPVGMMIVGKKWHEQDVLNVGFAHEQLQG